MSSNSVKPFLLKMAARLWERQHFLFGRVEETESSFCITPLPSFDAVRIRSMEYVYDFLSSFSCKFRSNSNTIPFRMTLCFRLILYISSFLPNAEDKSNMERKIDLKERLLRGKTECQREDVVGFTSDDLWCLSLIDMKRRGYWRSMLS